jgi:hypothetical protein
VKRVVAVLGIEAEKEWQKNGRPTKAERLGCGAGPSELRALE